MCAMTHMYAIHVTCLIHLCSMTHSYVCHDSYVCHQKLTYYHHPRAQSRLRWARRSQLELRSYTCDMTHSNVCYDLSTCVPWLKCVPWEIEIMNFFFSCHPTSWSIQSSMSARRSRLGRRWYLRSRAPVSGSWWYNSVWVMSLVCHSYEWYITHVNESVSALQHAATHCNTLQHTATHCNTLQHTATHCNTWYNSGITPMLIAHLWMTYGATQVSFAKEPYKRNDILQKKSLCQYRS